MAEAFKRKSKDHNIQGIYCYGRVLLICICGDNVFVLLTCILCNNYVRQFFMKNGYMYQFNTVLDQSGNCVAQRKKKRDCYSP